MQGCAASATCVAHRGALHHRPFLLELPMSTTYAYAATAATAPLAPFEIQRRELRPNDVQMEVQFCGVCHSDLHQARNEWSNTVVPGHEIVGRVSAVGPEVTKYKAGDLVGVGCLVDSCRTCASCAEGLEQY